MSISDQERKRLKAIQDAIRESCAGGEPQTAEDLHLMFERMRAAASPKQDPERAKKIELAQQLSKWLKP